MKQPEQTEQGKQGMHYFDHAATSWAKPEGVPAVMHRLLSEGCANPGRSGHRLSIEAARLIYQTREAAARLLGTTDPRRIIFTANATASLNIAIAGSIGPGDHVVTSSMEHNSVMRPLRTLEAQGTSLTVLPCSTDGSLDPRRVEEALRPETKMIVLTHASNVTGTIMPIEAVAALARDRGVLLCVDAAQTAGIIPIDVEGSGIDLLAFTGHKSLYGPQGTGGLSVRRGLEDAMTPLLTGGTGSLSEREEQPFFMPDRFESGTPNTPGIAALGAGIDFVLEKGISAIRAKELQLLKRFLAGLAHLKHITLHGNRDADSMTPVLSLSLPGMAPSRLSQILDEEFDIMTRPGLHCAPAAHRTLGTFPAGTVRFSFGWFTDETDIDAALNALEQIRP